MALKYYSDAGKNLGLFDTVTGEVTIIGNTGRVFTDIAQNSAGQLYGVAYEAGVSKIYSINVQTGTSKFLWDVKSAFLNALATDNNNLYAAGTDGHLYKITNTGAVSDLGIIGNAAGDLVVVDNNVYMSNTSNQLIKFDLTTNTTTVVSNLPEKIYGLATADNGNLIGTTPTGIVYEINLTTGASTKTGADVNIPSEIFGIADAFVTPTYTNIVFQDFENIAGAVNDWNYVGLPNGWYTDNPSGIIEVGTQEAYGIVSDVVGNKIIEIEAATGDFNLYTMVQTTKGTDVTITFDAAQRLGYISKVAVLVDGKEIGLIFPQTQTLEPFAFTAPGTGQPMRIEFKSTDSNAFGVIMDNINVLQPFQNQAPVAGDDEASGKQDADIVISASTLLANDQDADGDALSILKVDNAINGTVKIEGDKVTFTPNAGYAGPASFTYTAFDGKDGTSVATVNLIIAPTITENQAPIAKDDAVAGFKNNEFVISPNTLLGNDSDPEGGAITGVGLGNAVNGNVYWDGTNVIFTPTPGYSGPASFTYTIADDKGVESTATVNLTIENNASATNMTNGTATSDSLIDSSSDDVIYGLAGDDKIAATEGNDTLVGGAGNDIMQGGAGADTYTWTLADTAAAGIEIDTLYADGNDKLNMKDLLVGEANSAESLDNYLHFSFENGNTVISVSSNGTFADNNTTGVINNGTVDQKIVLAGFDLTAGNTASDMQVIQNLLNGNHLITD